MTAVQVLEKLGATAYFDKNQLDSETLSKIATLQQENMTYQPMLSNSPAEDDDEEEDDDKEDEK